MNLQIVKEFANGEEKPSEKENIEDYRDGEFTITQGHMRLRRLILFVLSLIPIFLLLLTMVQFTPVTMNDVLQAVLQVFPSTVTPLIRSIVIQVYTQSGGIIPVSIVVALWSAGKGVLSVTSGLNCIYANIETRNYIYLRLRASLYYGDLPSGDHAVACTFCIRKQYQCDAL